MLKELKGMEYTLEVLRVFYLHPGRHDTKEISQFIEKNGKINPSISYLAKILPRMRKADLLTSSELGYCLAKSIDEITVDMVLGMCPMPEKDSPLYHLCLELKRAVSLTGIDEFYDFN